MEYYTNCVKKIILYTNIFFFLIIVFFIKIQNYIFFINF
jgi:hypothetical protein